MGLKRLWLRILRKTKKRRTIVKGTHFIETLSELSILPRGFAVKREVNDEAKVSVNKHGLLYPLYLPKNESFPSPSIAANMNDATVALQVVQCSMPPGMPPADSSNIYTEDTGTAIIPRNQIEPYEATSISVPLLHQSILLNSTIPPSDQLPKPDCLAPIPPEMPLAEYSNMHTEDMVTAGVPRNPTEIYEAPSTSDPSLHQSLLPKPTSTPSDQITNPECSTPILPLTRPQSLQTRNDLPNQPQAPINDEETIEDLLRSEPSVDESNKLVSDASNQPLDHPSPRTTQITQFHESKPLPEIPQQIPEETVSVLEPEEVILYPRRNELEALRRQFSSSPQVKDNETQHSSTTTVPEMGHEAVVGGYLFEPQFTLKPPYLLEYSITENPSSVVHAPTLPVTRRGARGAPQSRHGFLYSSPPASALPPLESFFPSASTRSKYSIRDSLFSALDMYYKDDLTDVGNHTSWHPWNVRFIGQGASGKVLRVGYKTEIWDPDDAIPGAPPIAFGKESQVASVKVIDMKRQTEGTLLGLASEVVALKVLSRKRRDIAEAQAKGKHMRFSDGLRYLLESAYLPGIDETVVLRADRLYLLTKYYHCDLTNYNFKISNDERSLAFILSELTQGLNYLHHIGIVHLDLKPSNIFITHDLHCVIGDLGSSIYQPGCIMANEAGILVDVVTSYTDGFCAPEITQSRYHTDRFNCKVDFWSLGVTIYDVVRPDGLLLPRISNRDSEDDWRQRRDYDGMGLGAKYMARMMYDVGCPGRIVNLVLNLCQRDPKKRLGGRGILKNLKDQLGTVLSSPLDPSPLPNIFIPPCGRPRPETTGSYTKLDVKDACKTLKEYIESKDYKLAIQE